LVKVVRSEALWAVGNTLISLVNVSVAGCAGVIDDVSVELSWALNQTLIFSLEPASLAGDANICA
jgi:hypothetical protein